MLRPMCDAAYAASKLQILMSHALSHTTPNITLQFNNIKQYVAVSTLTNYISNEPIKRLEYTKLRENV